MTQQKSIASIEKQINEISQTLEARALKMDSFERKIFSALIKLHNDRIFNEIKNISAKRMSGAECALELTSFLREINKDIFEGTKKILPAEDHVEFDDRVGIACAGCTVLFLGAFLLSCKVEELKRLKGASNAHSVN